MEPDVLDRRTMLKLTATGVAATALAGCTTTGDEGDSTTEAADTETEATEAEDGGSGDAGAEDFDGWFDNVDNFDGVVDETGADEVTVEVGAEGNGGSFAFSPAAVRVSAGTTVVWEWTGQGSFHDVVADGGEFESEQTDEEGHTFTREFAETGTYEYYCTPHEAMGMKGAIVVE